MAGIQSISQTDTNYLSISDFENWTGINQYETLNNVLIIYVYNLRELTESQLIKQTALRLKNGEVSKVILYCADMDWVQMQSQVDIIVNNLNDIFGENIDKIVLTLCSMSWGNDWKNIKTIQNLGFLSMVIDRNIQFGKDYNLLNIGRQKHFITMNNEPRPMRIYLYDYLIKNNLLHKFEYSFFASQKDYITWDDRIGGDDGLARIDGVFPKKTFEGEIYQNHKYDFQLVNMKHELNSYFSLIMETNYMSGDASYYAFSEKSFKGFVMKKPFMLWASPLAPKGLNQLGFKLYDKIFDVESWDNSSHDFRRVRFFDDIKRICELPINQIENMYVDNLETIEHNYNNLIRLIQKEKEDFINLVL